MSFHSRALWQQRCAGVSATTQRALKTITPAVSGAAARQSSSDRASKQQQHQQQQVLCRAAPAAAAAAAGRDVDQTLNPRVASLSISKTMALTDMARSMKESGIDVSRAFEGDVVGSWI
jgi:3'-phosphoadenosine 5'-phosphosulfate (PAPS) 3'-phosphatase